MFEQLRKEIIESAGVTPRDAAIFLRVLGLDGGDAASLRRASGTFGLSPERVRQIAANAQEAFATHVMAGPGWGRLKPALDQLLAAIHEICPGTDARITSELERRGLLVRDSGSASSVVRIAALCATNPNVQVVSWSETKAIVALDYADCYSAAIATARRIATSSGAVSGQALVDQYNKTASHPISIAIALAMLDSAAVEVGMSGDQRWYCFPTITNDAVEHALSLVSSLGAGSLCQLTSAEGRFTRSTYAVQLPQDIMAKLLQRYGMNVDGDKVTLADGVAPVSRSSIQKTMVDVMRRLGGQAKQNDFIRACVDAGIKPSTARVYLHRSGLFSCDQSICKVAA